MGKLTNSSTSLVEGKNAILSEELTIFLLDVSGSMDDYIDNSGCTKLHAMKNAAKKFVLQRGNAITSGATDKVGIITFGSDVKVLTNPDKFNPDLILSKINSLHPGGCTPLASALRKAEMMSLSSMNGFIRVVVVTDGYPDNAAAALDVVNRLYNDAGIVFDTIGVGRDGGFNEDFLIKMAELGGGEFTKVSSPSEFDNLFLKIEGERQALIGNGILLLE